MRRFAGAVLAGLGGLLLTFAVGLPLFVTPAVAKLPYNLQPCAKADTTSTNCLRPSVADAVNAQVVQVNATGINFLSAADLRSTTEVIPDIGLTADQQDAGKLNANAVVWSVYRTVALKSTNEPIAHAAFRTQLALDRTTGEAIPFVSSFIDDRAARIQYTGLTYKFPFGTEKRDYQIYDRTVRAASTAKFQAVEDVGGLSTYHFVQQIPETADDEFNDVITVLMRRFAPEATSAKVTYRNTREVWVDPVTGAFMKVREHEHLQMTGNEGTTQVLLDADFNSTPDTVASNVASAKDSGSQLKLISVYAPVGGVVLGLLLAIVGVLLIRQPVRGGYA
jgi:hypothetical protein